MFVDRCVLFSDCISYDVRRVFVSCVLLVVVCC